MTGKGTSTEGKPWYWHPTRNRVLVADLREGDVITGTGPSGDFESGPVVVERIITDRRLGVPRVTYTLNLRDGGALHYWGDTVVEVKR